jgi:membrane associated rhomboid family serine protease
MSSDNNLPPNPREARYRRAPVVWTAFPVTVVMIIACVIVAAVSRIGEDEKKVDILFFAGEPSEAEHDALWKEHVDRHLESYTSRGVVPPDDFREILEQTFSLRVNESRKGIGSFSDIAKGEVWRLFTPMFPHFGLIHLLFNMMWLWDFGRMLESRFRSLRFALLVLGVCVAANVVQAYLSGPRFGGMSGVNYGLFGFILMRQKFHPAGDVRLNPQTTPYLLVWLVVCFTGIVGPVANAAHVAGLVAGAAIGWINAMMGGGWAQIKRRQEFQRAVSRSDSSLHRCAVCKKTERDDPNMDFRVGEDGDEYCMEHLPPR